jgi:hypothetical protein
MCSADFACCYYFIDYGGRSRGVGYSISFITHHGKAANLPLGGWTAIAVIRDDCVNIYLELSHNPAARYTTR